MRKAGKLGNCFSKLGPLAFGWHVGGKLAPGRLYWWLRFLDSNAAEGWCLPVKAAWAVPWPNSVSFGSQMGLRVHLGKETNQWCNLGSFEFLRSLICSPLGHLEKYCSRPTERGMPSVGSPVKLPSSTRSSGTARLEEAVFFSSGMSKNSSGAGEQPERVCTAPGLQLNTCCVLKQSLWRLVPRITF